MRSTTGLDLHHQIVAPVPIKIVAAQFSKLGIRTLQEHTRDRGLGQGGGEGTAEAPGVLLDELVFKRIEMTDVRIFLPSNTVVVSC